MDNTNTDKIIMRNGDTVEITRDRIDVTPIEEKDPSWLYTDKEGHEHRWHIPHGANDWSKDHLWSLPTLRAVSYVYCHSYDGEPIYGVHYYCKRCGELIKPGWRVSCWRRFILGPPYFHINGVLVSQERAKLAMKEIRDESSGKTG